METQEKTETKEKRIPNVEITNRVIGELLKGIVPWRESWGSAGQPQNLVTKQPYRWINTWNLASTGYEKNFFLTFDQVKELNAKIKKGEKSTMAVYWRKLESEGEAKEKTFFLGYYNVFNVSQCENLPEGIVPPIITPENPVEACENILRNMPNKPKIESKEKNAFYNPEQDLINVPKIGVYKKKINYYSALFQQLIHSTGHKDRLDRKIAENDEFKIDPFSMEELIGEIGAAFLLSLAGFDTDTQYEWAYIQGWMQKLKEDNRILFHASARAQEAINFILNEKNEPA